MTRISALRGVVFPLVELGEFGLAVVLGIDVGPLCVEVVCKLLFSLCRGFPHISCDGHLVGVYEPFLKLCGPLLAHDGGSDDEHLLEPEGVHHADGFNRFSKADRVGVKEGSLATR